MENKETKPRKTSSPKENKEKLSLIRFDAVPKKLQ